MCGHTKEVLCEVSWFPKYGCSQPEILVKDAHESRESGNIVLIYMYACVYIHNCIFIYTYTWAYNLSLSLCIVYSIYVWGFYQRYKPFADQDTHQTVSLATSTVSTDPSMRKCFILRKSQKKTAELWVGFLSLHQQILDRPVDCWSFTVQIYEASGEQGIYGRSPPEKLP